MPHRLVFLSVYKDYNWEYAKSYIINCKKIVFITLTVVGQIKGTKFFVYTMSLKQISKN